MLCVPDENRRQQAVGELRQKRFVFAQPQSLFEQFDSFAGVLELGLQAVLIRLTAHGLPDFGPSGRFNNQVSRVFSFFIVSISCLSRKASCANSS
jgi:hypothetical protein